MRKLILASNGWAALGFIKEIAQETGKELNIAWITNAKKGAEDVEYIEDRKEQSKELGLELEEIDLDDYKEELLKEKLIKYGLIFIEGGNPFYLLKSLRDSGFGNIARDLLDQGIVYVGSSAGTIITCPTIEISTWTKPERLRFGIEDLKGMNLIPFLIRVHYNKDMNSWLIPKVKECNFPVRLLKEGQAFLVEDDKITLIGGGEEEKL